MLPAHRIDAPGHEQGFFGPLGPKRLEDGVQEQVLDRDPREVPADEGLASSQSRSVTSETADFDMSSSPVASLKASSASLVERPLGYISATKRSKHLGVFLQKAHQGGG